jgi:hypothetical protein
LREYAALKNYHLLADEFELQKRVETGWPLYGVGPLVAAVYSELTVAEEGGYEMLRRTAENQILNHGVHYMHAVLHAPHVTPWSPFEYIYTNYRLDVDMQKLFQPAMDYSNMKPMDHPFGDRHRLKLINRIICEDRPLALEKRMAADAITNFYPLHNKPALNRMQDEWRQNIAWPWNGYFTPPPWLLSTIKLDPVRDYFGEKIGFYFAFLGWYTSWLTTVALFGAAIAVHRYFIDNSGSSTLMPVYAVAIQIWAVLMLRLWKQQESILSLRWGMATFKETEDSRPSYKGEIVWDVIGSGQRKVLWGSKVAGPPKWAVMLAMFTMVFLLVGGVYAIRVIISGIDSLNKTYAELIISVLTAFQIELLNSIVKKFAIRLVNGENHRTDSQYEAALIMKVFLFQFMNSYFPVYYLAFFQPMVDQGNKDLECSKYECTDKVALLLVVLLAVHCLISSVPSIISGSCSGGEDSMKKYDIDQAEEEANMAVYDPSLGPLEDCEQIALQFGYVMLFTTTAPWAPMAALVFNLVEMRLDSKHLLFNCQRPVPTSAPGFGKWYDVFCIIVFIGIVTNIALIVFVIDHIPVDKAGERVWVFTIMQYAVYGMSGAILLSISTTSEVVQIQMARTQTWVTRIFLREIVLEENRLFDAEEMPTVDVLEQNGMSSRELDVYRRPGMAPHELLKYRRPSTNTIRSRAIVAPIKYPPLSWCCFKAEGPLRQFCLMIAKSDTFDAIILFCIALNTFTLATQEYRPECCNDKGQPSPINGCPWNKFGAQVDPYLTYTFMVEFLVKVTALGWSTKSNGYFADNWNCLDAFVVGISVIEVAEIGGIGDLSVLRTFRVLRPLKSLSRFPELGALVKASMDSGPELIGVVLVLLFVMFFFTVFGLQIYQGQFTSRCRLTPYPVTYNPIEGVTCDNQHGVPMSVNDDCYTDYVAALVQDPGKYQCVFKDGTILSDNELSWRHAEHNYLKEGVVKEKSVWHRPQDCWWPIDLDDTRLCALPQNSDGKYYCKNPWPAYEVPEWLGDVDDASIQARTYCGSDYDRWGNPRFTDLNFPYGFSRMLGATYNEDFAWGMTTFDSFPDAFVTIFQCVSMEGWTSVLYMGIDVAGYLFSCILFILLIVIGAFIVLNIVLAILSASVENANAEAEEEAKEEIITGPNDEHKAVKVKKGEVDEDEDDAEKEAMCSLNKNLERLNTASIIAVLANTIFLSLDSYPPSPMESFYGTMNELLTYFFIFELVVKMCIMAPSKYFNDYFNCFDFFIVFVSIVEMIMKAMGNAGGGGISALRAFRIFRVFKAATQFKQFQILLATMLKSLLGVSNVAILLLLFILIYGLIGMQFFANRMRFDPDTGWKRGFSKDDDSAYYSDDIDIPYNNFDTIWWAMLTVFQVLSGEDWNAVMYDGRRAGASQKKYLGHMASIYFISMVVLGSFIVMNLFLAILLSNLGPDEGEEEEEEEDEAGNDDAQGALGFLAGSAPSAKVALEEDDDDDSVDIHGDKIPEKEPEREDGDAPPQKALHGRIGEIARSWEQGRLFDVGMLSFVLISTFQLALDCPICDPKSDRQKWSVLLNDLSTAAFSIEFVVKIVAYGFTNKIEFPVMTPEFPEGEKDADGNQVYAKRAYFTGRDSGSNLFDFFILLCSYIDAATGGAIEPLVAVRALKPLRLLNRSAELKMLVHALASSMAGVGLVAVIVALFFLIFAVVGVSYMKGGFNTCDGTYYGALSGDVQDLIFAPKAWEKLTQIEKNWFVDAQFELSDDADDSISKGDYGFATCIEANSDGGYQWSSDFTFQKEYYPSGALSGNPDEPTSEDLCKCIIDHRYIDDMEEGDSEWVAVSEQNFDNVINAFMLLFEISTTEGWTAVMYCAFDSRGIGMQPERYYEIWFPMLYFVSFMMIGCFFCVELFVGVIIDQFNTLRNESTHGSAMLTEHQVVKQRKHRFHTAFTKCEKLPYYVKFTYDIAQKEEFDAFIMGCIVFNSCLMAASHVGQPTVFTDFVGIMNYAFAIIFTFEVVIKWTGFGKNYFNYYKIGGGWNIFDFTVVLGTWLGIILELLEVSNLGPVGSLLRMLRLGRIMRMVPKFKVLRKLVEVISEAGSALINATIFISLVFFFFAVAFVQLFSKDWIDPDSELNVYAHFQDLGTALLTLFRFATGENWNGFMYSMINAKLKGCKDTPNWDDDGPFCRMPDPDGTMYDGVPCKEVNGCPSKEYLYLFFYLFTVSVAFIMINLFVGVIVDAHDSSKTVCVLEEYETTPFFKKWVDEKFNSDYVDIHHNNTITIGELENFFARVAKPLGFKDTPHGKLRQKELIGEMQIRVRRGPYKAAMDEGLPFDQVELDLMDVFEGAVRHAARIKRNEDLAAAPGSRPPEAGLRVLFGDLKKSEFDGFFEWNYSNRGKVDKEKFTKPVKLPGTSKPMDIVLVHPIDRPAEYDENGKKVENGRIPDNKIAQEAYQKYKERFPIHNPEDILKGALGGSPATKKRATSPFG